MSKLECTSIYHVRRRIESPFNDSNFRLLQALALSSTEEAGLKEDTVLCTLPCLAWSRNSTYGWASACTYVRGLDVQATQTVEASTEP